MDATAESQPLEWQQDSVIRLHRIKHSRVTSRSDHLENNCVDELAVAAYQKAFAANSRDLKRGVTPENPAHKSKTGANV